MQRTLLLPALAVLVSCSKSDPPAPTATATATSASAAPAETPIVFDPKMPSFKCGKIRCNTDYYCVERKQGTPTELCTSHPPGPKHPGCTRVATRSYTCETFP